MSNDWKAQLANTRRAAGTLNDANPKFVQAFQALNAAQRANGNLDAKTRELIALAVAVTLRCDSCIASHASAARQAGATESELSEALGTAIAPNPARPTFFRGARWKRTSSSAGEGSRCVGIGVVAAVIAHESDQAGPPRRGVDLRADCATNSGRSNLIHWETV